MINDISSVYFRKKKTGAPQDQWFVTQVKNGNLLYVNTNKASAWSTLSGTALPIGTTFPHGQASRGFINSTVKTEADLVKLRQQRPDFYQDIHGQTSFSEGGALVRLFGTAGRSTLLHETAHVFLQDLQRLALHNLARCPRLVGKITQTEGFCT